MYTIILNFLQLTLLYLTKIYYLYLIIKIVMRLVENMVISYVANKKYPYIKDNNIQKLDKNTENDIFAKVRALFFHKIGSFVVLGTDNIVISKFLGLVTVGLYSNYFLIINAVQMVFGQMIQATTASIGNLLVTETKEKCFDVFKKIRFLNFWIATFSSIAVLVIMDSFITIWIGDKFILSHFVLIVLVINLYQKLMRNSYSTFKEAAGIFYEDRFVPLVEAMINIVVSIVCCKIFGLAGVFIGTIVSGLALWCYSYPKFVYVKLFGRDYASYIKETIGYLFLFLGTSFITYLISLSIAFTNVYLEFFSNVFISLIVPNIILLVIFFKTYCFKYYYNLILKRK